MAVSQNDLLSDLEAKVRYLMTRYEALEKERKRLEDDLRECKEERDLARAMEFKWRDQYYNLLTAKTISTSEDEAKKTLSRLSNMEREIDKCIKMLLEE